jgi:hypothetical protein
MNEVRTDPRSLVRILLRGVALSSVNAIRLIAGHRALLVGLARAESWPNEVVEVDDIEAAVWTTERQAEAVARAVLTAPEVIAVRTPRASPQR